MEGEELLGEEAEKQEETEDDELFDEETKRLSDEGEREDE
jgi:hypothetical protein